MSKPAYKKEQKKGIIILVSLLLIIFGILYIYKWYQVKEQKKYQDSYLISSKTIFYTTNEINSIDTELSSAETPDFYFVYLTFTGNEDVYNLEKKLKPIIDEYNIQNNFYLINITESKKEKDYKKKIASKLDISEKELTNIPVILYFNDGELVEGNVTNASEFKSLLEKYDIKSM